VDYDLLATFYDSFIDPEVYETYLELLDHYTGGGTLLDIGCGTGTLSLELAKRGFDVTATDLSNEMVQIVQYRATEENINLKLFVYDMLDPLGDEFDTVVASMDVLNHLTSLEDVEFGVQNIFDSLNNHGIFAFDVLSAEYIDLLDGYIEDDEEFKFHWECHKGSTEHSIVHSITVHLEAGDHDIEIYEETHDIEAYRAIVCRVGFVIIEERTFAERTIFVLQKNIEERI
jgi:2-polyprenyl-3-methyl-5-hydroxy-6-metoxy-1,4-benzoquinol methylase